MEDVRDRLFVSYEEGGLTVRELLALFQQQAVAFPTLEEESFKDHLNRVIKNTVAADLISREAYRQNLDETEEVRHDLATWEDHWAASEILNRIKWGITATDQEAVDFLARHGAALGTRYEVNVREVLVDSLPKALTVIREVAEGRELASIAASRSRRKGWSARGGESGYFNVGAHPRLGFPALFQQPGTLGGPLLLPEGYSLFETLGSRMAEDGGPPRNLDSVLTIARRGALAEKGRDAVIARVDSLAREAGVWLNLDRLRTLDVVRSNMVTQRFIGFGGTMIAVPTILPIWQWIYRPPDRVPPTPL
jgi:hypothetical protein